MNDLFQIPHLSEKKPETERLKVSQIFSECPQF